MVVFLLPYDRILAKEFKNFGIHHCGKSMEHVSEGYAALKELCFAEVGAFSDITAVRAAMPGIHLNARYSPVRLKDAGFEQMKAELSNIIGRGRPLSMLSISCVGIDASTPDDRIRDFILACRNAEEYE